VPKLRTPTALLLSALLAGAAQAAPPSAPAAPLAKPSIAWPADDPALGERDWREANDTVGRFERGHIDLLRWEAANLPEAAEATDTRPLLTAGAAVRAAFSQRPALFASSGMNALERALADVAAVELAREVQQAWVSAVAAQAALRHAEREFEAASVADELAARMTAAGNWGRDRLVGKRLDLADAAIALVQARHAAFAAREALVRASGLAGEAAEFSLPSELATLPETLQTANEIETAALQAHPLLSVLTAEAERADSALSQGDRKRWESAAEAALPDAGNTALPTAAPFIDLRRTPLSHDVQRAVRSRADAALLRVRVASQAREAWHGYAAAHEVASVLTGRVLPLAAEREDDMLLRYNGMLKSTWDLIDATRERVAAETAALEATRDFWLAHINLQAVLAGAEHVGGGSGVARNTRGGAAGGH